MITVADLSITEGNVTGAMKQAWLTIKLAQKSTAWVTVNYTTSPGSALADVDYYTVSDVAYFSPGVLTQSVAIPIVQDTVGELTESFYVDFSGSVNGVLGQARATITIVNDDSSTNVVSSIADFSAGTLGGGAYLSETADGELMLAPQGSEFSGTSLPEGWTSTALEAGASAIVANGSADDQRRRARRTVGDGLGPGARVHGSVQQLAGSEGRARHVERPRVADGDVHHQEQRPAALRAHRQRGHDGGVADGGHRLEREAAPLSDHLDGDRRPGTTSTAR